MKQFCAVCNLWLNSEDQYGVHLVGKAHKSKVAAAMLAGNTNPCSQKAFPHTFISFVQSKDTGICCTPPASITPAIQQVRINQHTKQASVAVCAWEKVPKPNPKEFFCSICVVKLTSKTQANMHFEGARHKKALTLLAGKAVEPAPAPAPESVKRKRGSEVCETCNVPLCSPSVAQAHYAGSKHAKKSKMAGSIGKTVTEVHPNHLQTTAVVSSPHLATTVSQFLSPLQTGLPTVHAMPPAPPEPPEPPKKKQAGSLLFCSFCNISVNSLTQMEAHRQGTKHQNMVRSFAPQKNPRIIPAAVTPDHSQLEQVLPQTPCTHFLTL